MNVRPSAAMACRIQCQRKPGMAVAFEGHLELLHTMKHVLATVVLNPKPTGDEGDSTDDHETEAAGRPAPGSTATRLLAPSPFPVGIRQSFTDPILKTVGGLEPPKLRRRTADRSRQL